MNHVSNCVRCGNPIYEDRDSNVPIAVHRTCACFATPEPEPEGDLANRWKDMLRKILADPEVLQMLNSMGDNLAVREPDGETLEVMVERLVDKGICVEFDGNETGDRWVSIQGHREVYARPNESLRDTLARAMKEAGL